MDHTLDMALNVCLASLLNQLLVTQAAMAPWGILMLIVIHHVLGKVELLVLDLMMVDVLMIHLLQWLQAACTHFFISVKLCLMAVQSA